MLDEPFSLGSSRLHRMDARCKLPVACLCALVFALIQSPEAAAAALGYAVLLVAVARLPLFSLLKRLAVVNIFIGLLWLFLPFSTPGTPVTTLGPFTATHEGLQLATLITLKSNAIVLSFIALAATSSITAMGGALRALRVPDKLSLLFLFTWRYVHVIAQEYSRLHTAAKVRGFVPSTAMHTYRTYANLAAMVLIRSWDRAERVNDAMRLRGFTGTFRSLRPAPLSGGDAAIAVLLSLPPLVYGLSRLISTLMPISGTS
ncbi:cobalt ECF transporter T component CbiQ [Desulfovibrio psychrotolerans]|uniref:Cobalt ECF transporter T component CbiQ n=1 Tax=Desulfovibrio psychrotolerans TaxID=415242 RepID=A0A7J0BRC7_9BACT|nr:cobalt ECF transporter T component CbiQ [Desulfovibrio psychrotolerans]GFM35771.1 cobalt ECF transporter T component CbiQ [Desulfovibrio psychrotolerans]